MQTSRVPAVQLLGVPASLCAATRGGRTSSRVREGKGSRDGAVGGAVSPSRAPSSVGLCCGFLCAGGCNVSAAGGPGAKMLLEVTKASQGGCLRWQN